MRRIINPAVAALIAAQSLFGASAVANEFEPVQMLQLSLALDGDLRPSNLRLQLAGSFEDGLEQRGYALTLAQFDLAETAPALNAAETGEPAAEETGWPLWAKIGAVVLGAGVIVAIVASGSDGSEESGQSR